MNLGGVVRKLRLQQNISQKEFASLLTISAPYLSRIENGHDKIQPDLLLIIGTVLGVKPSQILLMGYEGNPESTLVDDLIEYFGS